MQYERLIKDCFWEYNFTEKDIKKLFNSSNFKEKQFLYEKILLNSSELLNDLSLFDRNELKMLSENYTIPTFNQDYISRRQNIVQYFFLDKPLLIDELKWVA